MVLKMLDGAKAFNTKKTHLSSTTYLDTQVLVSEKVDDKEEKDRNYVMEGVEIRKCKLDKFIDQFEETERI